MQYMLVMTETEEDYACRADPEKAESYWAAWGAYAKAIEEAGIMVGGNGLEPPHTATTVRVRDGKREIHDGPFAETRETLAGYFVVDVPDLDTAIEWASKSLSASSASAEVRPLMQGDNGGSTT